MRTVVCEDDVVVRRLVTQLATDAGHEVIAETDNPLDAVDLVDRFGAELVVLDLNLPVRSGTDMLTVLRERGLDPSVIVFTAYAADEAELRRAGAVAVVEKPDFGALEDILADVASATPPTQEADRRRGLTEREPFASPTSMSRSGVEGPHSFAAAVDALWPSDTLLVLHVSAEPADAVEDAAWAGLADADRRLAIARLLRKALRTQDRLSVTAEGDLVALLMNGGPDGAKAVVDRLAVLRHRERVGVAIAAGYAVHATGDLGVVTLARARGAAAQASGDGLVPG